MFLKEKHLPDGSFERYKARLMGDGSMQDRNVIQNLSSPTASFTFVLIGLKYAAMNKMKGMKIDVKRAFLNALLDEVYIMLDRKSTEVAVSDFPELKEMVFNGHLYVLGRKAIYRLVQAARLWYDTIRAVLRQFNFQEIEQCVFKRRENILILYVDDLLLLSNDDTFFEEIQRVLIEEFEEITVEKGETLNYLGMSVHFDESKLRLSMKGYVESLLKGKRHEKSSVPETKDIFINH